MFVYAFFGEETIHNNSMVLRKMNQQFILCIYINKVKFAFGVVNCWCDGGLDFYVFGACDLCNENIH